MKGLHTSQTKLKISLSKKGQVSPRKGVVLSQEIKDKISFSKKGNSPAWNKGTKTGLIPPNVFKKGHIPWSKGKSIPAMQGPNHPRWTGGIRTDRRCFEYTYWRKNVLKRDDYTCQACGKKGGKLQVDHELPFAYYPDLRFEILNGRTLCKPCHLKTPTWGSRAKSFQLI